MKIVFILVSIFTFFQSLEAQTVVDPQDVESIDGLMKAYYEVVSGAAGEPRDVGRDSTLHMAGAGIVIIGDDENGNPIANRMTLADFHAATKTAFDSVGFFEYEISRSVETRGALSNIWSTYEWKQDIDGPVGGRGINSIQVYHDGDRYWILSWQFDNRDAAGEIPNKYLPEHLRREE